MATMISKAMEDSDGMARIGFRTSVIVILSLLLVAGGTWVAIEAPWALSQRTDSATFSENAPFATQSQLPVVVPHVKDDLLGQYVWCNGTGNSTCLTLSGDGTCVVDQGYCFGEPEVLKGTWRRQDDLLDFDFEAKAKETDWFRPTRLRLIHLRPGYLLIVDPPDPDGLAASYAAKGVKRLFQTPRKWVLKAYAPAAVHSELYRCTGGRVAIDDPLEFAAQP